ncbi:MAG: class I SAM-dependent RNA methyltransferase [Mesorhizobium sp.]
MQLTIDRLGAQGDGIANGPRGPVYVQFALPGEVINAAVDKERGTLIALLEASPSRVEPSCRHFTECGGCTLQHLADADYCAFKRDRVMQALKRERIEADVEEIVTCAPRSRRRVTLTGRRTEKAMLLGYNRMQSHEIIDIEECPIALDEIVEALPRIKALAASLTTSAKPFHVTVTATETGLDVAFSDIEKLSDERRRAASHEALTQDVARLTVDGETIVEHRRPVIRFGEVEVSPPSGEFLQAVASAEAAMADMVMAHLAKAKRVADLFSGSGAFALRLGARSEVHAIEGEAAALAALDRGFRFAKGMRRITLEKRDLFRRPLTFKELNAFDGVVFDPPRAGAEDQSRQLARSDVPLVAAVSCNPQTLARDLRILMDGGYKLKSVTPVDQFLWSGHVEAVALLEKPKKRR